MPQVKVTAVQAAQQRRAASKASALIKEQIFIADVMKRVDLTVHQRTLLLVNFLRDKVVKNISVSVKVDKGPPVLIERSKPGEFPRADTTNLMKSIMGDVRKVGTSGMYYEGYVGTPVDYGVILELRRNRSFLVRTMNEELGNLRANMGGRLK